MKNESGLSNRAHSHKVVSLKWDNSPDLTTLIFNKNISGIKFKK